MEMPRKTRRIADSNIATLLRPEELMTDLQALDAFNLIERLKREVKIPNHRSIYLSDNAYKNFEMLTNIVEKFFINRCQLESTDIHNSCKAVLGKLYQEESPRKDIDSFVENVEKILDESISNYRFYTTIEGLDLEGENELKIGRLTVQKPDFMSLKQCAADDNTISSTWNHMKDSLWVTGEITGSEEYAERRFFEDVEATCGLLAVSLTTVLERGGAAVRLIPSMSDRIRPTANRWFFFSTKSKVLCTSICMRGYQKLTLNENQVSSLMGCEWFQELARVLQNHRDNDVEEAVRRGIYWFFDAQADMKPEMQLVKFWSCIECFFSFENDGQTTSKIKRGLTAILTCGRYGFSHTGNWNVLEKEINDLYDLRCAAVHDAQHSHINSGHVTTVSKWAAWLILEVSGLISEGFESRAAIKEEIDRVHDQKQLSRAKNT
ncbi:HEPN domain-containing protein [Halomonas binhaiensis]|uniref:Apea-like HEPN domain-containing protein n=1 Tax=Halomonas binhaiensis TaxID=2562282 RepID=A0A7U3K5S5_9GAMM|nr:HEPN domain-containing protein [Halomonas binhaiensis]QRG26803.1 hypothetical protein E4T21_21470 [Halomonas binhaiensis]